ncbi:hypothetical protein ACWIUD_01800 [Helicobacter sp. 23-1044]
MSAFSKAFSKIFDKLHKALIANRKAFGEIFSEYLAKHSAHFRHFRQIPPPRF